MGQAQLLRHEAFLHQQARSQMCTCKEDKQPRPFKRRQINLKRKEGLTQATVWMSRGNTVPRREAARGASKDVERPEPANPRIGSWSAMAGAGEGVTADVDRFHFGGDTNALELEGRKCPTLNVLDTTELCTSQW